MVLNKKLQCKSSFQENQLWHARRIVKQLLPEQKQQLLEQIQIRAQLFGEEVKNPEVLSLLKESNDNA